MSILERDWNVSEEGESSLGMGYYRVRALFLDLVLILVDALRWGYWRVKAAKPVPRGF